MEERLWARELIGILILGRFEVAKLVGCCSYSFLSMSAGNSPRGLDFIN